MLVNVGLWVFLCAQNLFVKKNKQAWNCLDNLILIYYSFSVREISHVGNISSVFLHLPVEFMILIWLTTYTSRNCVIWKIKVDSVKNEKKYFQQSLKFSLLSHCHVPLIVKIYRYFWIQYFVLHGCIFFLLIRTLHHPNEKY